MWGLCLSFCTLTRLGVQFFFPPCGYPHPAPPPPPPNCSVFFFKFLRRTPSSFFSPPNSWARTRLLPPSLILSFSPPPGVFGQENPQLPFSCVFPPVLFLGRSAFPPTTIQKSYLASCSSNAPPPCHKKTPFPHSRMRVYHPPPPAPPNPPQTLRGFISFPPLHNEDLLLFAFFDTFFARLLP